MNQSVLNPLEITIPKNTLKQRFNDICDIDKVIDSTFKYTDVSFINFYPFGVSVSEILGKYERYNDHRIFVNTYNSLLIEYFQPVLDLTKEVYRIISVAEGLFTVFGMGDFSLYDKTDRFKDDKFTSELFLESVLFESLKFWDMDWVVKRQQHIGEGLADICITSDNEKIAIELKKDRAQRKDVYQTYEYTKANSGYKAVLIASDFDDSVIELADEMDINCYKYCLATPLKEEVPSAVYLDPINNAREKTNIEINLEIINECDGHPIHFNGFKDPLKAEMKAINSIKKLFSDIQKAADYLQKQKHERIVCCPHCNNNFRL